MTLTGPVTGAGGGSSGSGVWGPWTVYGFQSKAAADANTFANFPGPIDLLNKQYMMGVTTDFGGAASGTQTVRTTLYGFGVGSSLGNQPLIDVDDTVIGDVTFDSSGIGAEVLWFPDGQQDTQGFIPGCILANSKIELDALGGVFTWNFGDNGVSDASFIVLERARS